MNKYTIREHLAGISGVVASFGVIIQNLTLIFIFTGFMAFWLWRENE